MLTCNGDHTHRTATCTYMYTLNGSGLRPGDTQGMGIPVTHMFFGTREKDVGVIFLGRVNSTFVPIAVSQVDDGRSTLVAHLRSQGQVTQVL